MERRSTNDIGYTHYQGDVTAQVGSSHGVRLSGGSTGGVVEAIGDDTNVTLRLRGQGAGGVVIGNSSQGVSVAGPSTFTGTQFLVQGASSIVLSPTSTAGVTIGNSSNQNPILITGSTVRLVSTYVSLASTRIGLGTGNQSSVGTVRMDYNDAIHARTSTDGNTVQMLKTSTGDIVYVGDATYGLHHRGSSVAITSTHVNLDSTRLSIGSSAAAVSTSYMIRVWRERIDFTVPAMAVNAGAEVGDIAVTGLTTNAVVTIAPRGALNSTIAGVAIVHAFCSTAGQLHLTLQNAGSTITGSTMSAYAMFHNWNIPA